MPIYWTAAARAGSAMSQQSQQLLAAGLAAAGWVLAAGIAWWQGDGEPNNPGDVNLSWEGSDSWKCCEHPYGECYGRESGCTGSYLE